MTNPYAPLIIVAVFTFLIVSVFLGLFDESVLALMTCFSADLDLNQGKEECPKWGPETLQNTVHNMFKDDDDEGKDEKQEGGNANSMA